MADIELVIKIPEEDFAIMKHNITVNNPLCPVSQEEMVSKVSNGVPLPIIIDKIRAEIEQNAFKDVNDSKYIFVNRVNQILDKYKTESEEC